MPNCISNKGVWHPAKEKIGLKNLGGTVIEHNGEKIQPGDPFVYEGPDRAALQMFFEQGVETMGTDFRRDPEFLQSVRNMGFQSGEDGVKAYLDFIGYNEKADEEKFKEQASVVNKHEMPKKHAEILAMGGGKDTSGSGENDQIGGFGDQKVRRPEEIKK